MGTTVAKTEGMAAIKASDIIYEAIKGVGMVGGYLQNILADTMYYAGQYVAYVRNVCSGGRISTQEASSAEGKVTILSLMKSDVIIDEADKKEFYMNFGRDMVKITKIGLESENLTIIDLSKYKL